ncbi:MAG: DUF1501 domain-containing protein [Planctomycetia bacterium]|nr:DUF1501 domain-containing protein [Planctomycetia bacterium]
MIQRHRDPLTLNRRDMLAKCGGGLGLLGLAGLLGDSGLLGSADAAQQVLNPLAPKAPNFAARAKSVIWIFVNGGPSQVDTWDYKPELTKRHGGELPGFDKKTGFFPEQVGALMKSPFTFTQHGQTGKWVSSLFPYLAQQVDRMAFIHSGYTKSNNHSPALFMMNTGTTRMGLPCAGSWVTYGLGSESRDLPAFVVMSDPKGRGLPKGNSSNWSAGFLPGVYQGTYLSPKGAPIANLERPAGMSDAQQRSQLNLLAQLNRENLSQHPAQQELAARIESFELAYRMQMAAPEAIAIEREPQNIRELYGLDKPECGHFARQCLIARRMVERGVRFVQIYSGGMDNQLSWDGHMDIQGNHSGFAKETDQPVAGLLADLAQRGLLDETLVIWGGEFGRLPIAQKGDKPGRDHNPHAFTYWLAGGGVKAGVSYGETDEVGFKSVVDRVSVNDLHATILHLLGINHERLTYRYNGRDFRLTDVAGNVIHKIIA